jgi:hypothetical protein
VGAPFGSMAITLGREDQRLAGAELAEGDRAMLRRFSVLGLLTFSGFFGSACTIKTPDAGSGGAPAATKPDPAPDAGGEAMPNPAAGRGPVEEPKEEPAHEPDEKPAPDPCAECASGFCLDDGTCVDCLPSNDHCPRGSYCTEANECVSGCGADDDCASGVCLADHNCKSCIDDRECSEGFLCSAGTCAPACTAEQEGEQRGCDDGLTCCSLRCADLVSDDANCGACGTTCEKGQFCGRGECRATTLASACEVSKVIVILDTNKNSSDGNRVPGRAIGAALSEQCPLKPTLIEAEQDSVEALNLTTGRPVSNSSELLVVAGGPFFQNLQGYLEEHRIAPLYWKVGTDAAEFRLSKNDALIASMPIAGDHDSRDIFIVQFMRDPDSGSLILNAQGFWLSGTVAAAYHLTNNLLPELSQQAKAWYAYEWTDGDADKAPDMDEFVLLDSGD